MTPDFFFSSAAQSPERHERAQAMLSMWRRAIWPVTVLQAEPGDSYYFQSERRKMAERLASTPIYILADDDMEPSRIEDPARWLAEGVKILERHPGFGILSPLLEDTTLLPSTVDGRPPYTDDDVFEVHNTGGIRFCRKGIVKEWPEQTRRGYDQEHCAAIQSQGYRVGYMKNLWAVHPGGKTETWKPITGYIAPRLLSGN